MRGHPTSRRVLLVGRATAALVALLALPALAHAEGAIALGVPDDVANQGLAFGRSWNAPNSQAAKERALKECRTAKGAPEETRKLCKITTTYSDQCAAIALDKGSGTPGWGYGIGDTAADAEAAAMRNCKRTAGKDRQKYCELGTTRCDGSAEGGERGTERRGTEEPATDREEPAPSTGNDAQMYPSKPNN